MAVEVWGNLPKAQDDSETIEQAIARIVAEHNAEPTAHTGAGEAIAVHRENDIIDHPAGSILGDKYTNRDFTIIPTFEDTTVYTKSATDIAFSLGGMRMQTTGTINTTRFLRAGGQYSPRYYKETQDTTFQFNAKFAGGSNYVAYGMAGNSGVLEVAAGIGFKFVNGAIYAAQVYSDSVGDPQESLTLISGPVASDGHTYRVELSVFENKVRWYIDSTLAHEADIIASTDYGLSLFEFYVKNTTAVNVYGYFSGVYLSISVA